jgi:hypothetical protein
VQWPANVSDGIESIISSLGDSPAGDAPMHRFSPLLFVIVISTPLLAQSIFEFDKDADLITVTTYCANVEDYSDSQVPRIFAQTTSAHGQSTGWVEFDTKAAWSRAGSPKPVASVWYRDAKIVRVAISLNDDESRRVYADYCYRQDGTLARLRSVPSVRQKCEPNRYQCTLVLREMRLYPPKGPVLKGYGVDRLLNVNGTTWVIIGKERDESLPAERVVETYVPMKWPEYRRVIDLPFSELFYATLR